jgi:catechol 2,3-dioxygenase-like lactoylglutathione lyase family enzyme
MNQGIKTIIYPVKDIDRAKSFYTKLLGVTPYVDSAYYVGFKVGDQDIGLIPTTTNQDQSAITTSATSTKACDFSMTPVDKSNKNPEM